MNNFHRQCIKIATFSHRNQGQTVRGVTSAGRRHLPATVPCWEQIYCPGGFGALPASQKSCHGRRQRQIIKKKMMNLKCIQSNSCVWLLRREKWKISRGIHGVVEVVDLPWCLSRCWRAQTRIVGIANHTLKPGQQASWWHGLIWVVTCKDRKEHSIHLLDDFPLYLISFNIQCLTHLFEHRPGL